jgi:hypothetical protein
MLEDLIVGAIDGAWLVARSKSSGRRSSGRVPALRMVAEKGFAAYMFRVVFL